jgi:outer membrane translocation and assembly module TamA
MTLSYEFIIARADEAATEAHEALLDNVRQRALRSEAAWRGMADLAFKMEREREKAELKMDRRAGAAFTGRTRPGPLHFFGNCEGA